MRENVAREYGIMLYRRYREKEAASIVGYEATWWKRHRKKGTILYVQDPGGAISYFGYMLCDLLIFGKDAVKRRLGPDSEPEGGAPAAPDVPPNNGPGTAARMIRDGNKD